MMGDRVRVRDDLLSNGNRSGFAGMQGRVVRAYARSSRRLHWGVVFPSMPGIYYFEAEELVACRS